MLSLAARFRSGFLVTLLVSDFPLAPLTGISAFALHFPNASSSQRFLRFGSV